jgi:predicted protein tyrosine phosphatase
MEHYCNDVNDWLTVGGDLDLALDVTGQTYQATIDELTEHGVTHVLDLRSEWDDRRTWLDAGLPPMNYDHVPVIDSWGHIPAEEWFRGVEDFVATFQRDYAEGDRLYIHCHMGINRAPSAAMLALLTVNPAMHPMEAFLQIREVRPVAGLVYAEVVGIRHLLNRGGVTTEDLVAAGELPAEVQAWSKAIRAYWTPERQAQRRQGIAYYRNAEGKTLVVDEALVS